VLLDEQTVVLLGRMTGFTAVCEACAAEHVIHLPDEAWVGARVTGSLAVEHDRGWASCDRGHRIRVIRAGRTLEPVLH
jgi:hypothetical protein